jgi:hypothetical protein
MSFDPQLGHTAASPNVSSVISTGVINGSPASYRPQLLHLKPFMVFLLFVKERSSKRSSLFATDQNWTWMLGFCAYLQ